MYYEVMILFIHTLQSNIPPDDLKQGGGGRRNFHLQVGTTKSSDNACHL